MASILKVDQLQKPDGSTPTAADLGIDVAGSVVQVTTVYKQDTYGTSTNVWNDITGLEVTITPKFNNSKILVLGNITCGTDSGNLWSLRMLRNGVVVDEGNSDGSKGTGLGSAGYRETNSMEVRPVVFLDSPATGSAITYKIQVKPEPGYAFYLNRTANNLDDYRQNRAASNIVLLEIAQ